MSRLHTTLASVGAVATSFLLDPHDYDAWRHGSIRDVIGFQHRAPFAAEHMAVEHTEDLWRSGKLPAKA